MPPSRGSFSISICEQRVDGAASAAIRVLSVRAHSSRAFLREQPPPDTSDSSFVIYVIPGFWFTCILIDKPSIWAIQTGLAVELPKIVVKDDRAGNRQVEGGHEPPLGDLDHQFRLVEQLAGHPRELSAEEETRSLRVHGVEDIDRTFVELDCNEIPPLRLQVLPKSVDIGELGDGRVELGCFCCLNVPLALANQNHLRRRRRVGGADQRPDVVLFGDVPGRDRQRSQTAVVLLTSTLTPFEASFHGQLVFEVGQ
jgi:hypothetical protein